MDIHPLPFMVYLGTACIATFVNADHARLFAVSVGGTCWVQIGEKTRRRVS